MPVSPGKGGGGGGGGGGLTLGPPQNTFTGSSKSNAETSRDNYGTANADWLAQYDAEPTFIISLTYGSTTTYQSRRGGSWVDVTPIVTGPSGRDGVPPIYQRWIFQASAENPGAPTSPNAIANAGDIPGLPSGWFYAPPDSTLPIWGSLQTVPQDRTVVTYTTPARWDGEDGSGGGIENIIVRLWSSGEAWRTGELANTARGSLYVAQATIIAGNAPSLVDPDDATDSLWRPVQGFAGTWVTGSDYRQGNIVQHSSRWYLVIRKISNSRTAPASDSTNFQLIGNQNLTDAEIGEKAFENPPSLSTSQQAAVRTAIGAGPGTNLDDLPIPEWADRGSYTAGELIRDPHNRVFMCIVDLNQSNNAPATDPTHFTQVTAYAGDYADSTAYPRGELVTHSDNTYFVNAAVGATNTDDPTTNSAFIQLNGGSVAANPAGSADGGNLTKIEIDGTVYDIPSGSSSGGTPEGLTEVYDSGASYPANTAADAWNDATLSPAVADTDMLIVAVEQRNGNAGSYIYHNTVASVPWSLIIESDSTATTGVANIIATSLVIELLGTLSVTTDTESGISLRKRTNGNLRYLFKDPQNRIRVRIYKAPMGGSSSGSGGTTVEANPSGAVDSGALTKLGVDGSIYSVAAGSGGGLTSVETDATLTGDGTSGDALSVANPFTDADEAVLDAMVQDIVVFWAQSAQHAAFDAVEPGDTIDINYGTGNADTAQAIVRGISRATNVAKIVIDPLTVWSAIVGGNTVIIEDSANNTIGSWQTAGLQTTRAGVTSFGDWWRQERAPGAGADVWEEMDRIDALDDTHLTIGDRTATTLEIASSTGNNVTIPSASPTLAGLESAADKTQLAASPPVWVTATAYDAGTQRVWQGVLYECIVDRTITDTDNPATDTTGWAPVTATGTTDLSVGTRTGTTMVVESSSGSNVTLPVATTSDAGLESAVDKAKTNTLPDVWSAKIWSAGDQCVYSNVIYICLVDRTASNTSTPDNDTSSWAPVTGDQDLSGYVETSTLTSDYSTTTEMGTAIANAIAALDALVDKGAWNNTATYAEHDFVRHSGASYVALGSVNAAIEPGVTTGWATSWYRLAYSAGPPTALTTPSLAGQVLQFPDIGGTTTEITLPTTGEADTAPATRVEQVKFQAVAAASTNVEGVPATTSPVSVIYPDGAERSIITSLNGNDITLKAGVYKVDIHGSMTGNTNNSVVTFDIRRSSDNETLDTSTAARLLNGTAIVGSSIASVALNEDTAINILVNRQNQQTAIAADWTVTFIRWGGSNSFDPATLGVDTFPLTGALQTIALTDDTSGNAIVCPETGWLLVESLIPGLGLNNKVDWYNATRLRADKAAGDGLYTNSANEILLQVSAHEGGATTGNIVRIYYTGATTPGGITPPPPALPQIRTFRVSGDKTVPAGNIQGGRYTYESQISQSSHVAAARIVGFVGTSQDPANVTQLHVIVDYSDESGAITLPSVTLTANQIYTIRLEVYETGKTFADTPSLYADYRITAVAATLSTHFGRVLMAEDHTDIAFATTDITTQPNAAGSYTINVPGTTENPVNYRLYWAVPTADTQPTGWTTGGFNITSTIETTQNVSISGNSYTVYLTEADGPYDASSNGSIIVVT